MKTISFLLLAFLVSIVANAQYSFNVQVSGKGAPVLLIPGYSCSGEVWNETVDHLKDSYECHVLTLPGYAGVAPIESSNILETVKNDILTYVSDKKLNKPMLIGHSLGAFMSMWLSSEAPDTFGKVVCVDGVPFISAMTNPMVTEESIKNNPMFDKATIIERYKQTPDEGYVENMTTAMLQQVSDSVHAKQVAIWSFKSDRATLGSTMVEMSLTDLRDDIVKVKQPVLILASTFMTKENSLRIYNEQYKLLPNKRIEVADSKHFIMYDATTWFFNQIDAFLNE
ncbi:alpha/beta fold hydrolase [Neptunitalea lumnitzerae]|uniref:Alpha/beta hydrolase n=1 Tax=Neptunitalea lumnitzerae TaxID=2965509 RepID=A0ABQ5MKW2_9FLAO|nr:alpha/beta hydrolase [Neptunitalea sp. Y10]GLB50055.1 alpha/beta hydrolase [Neptunitalea sp. Y10]